MSRISYVNGSYIDNKEAKVNIEDRGYQFADGVYEVFAVIKNIPTLTHLKDTYCLYRKQTNSMHLRQGPAVLAKVDSDLEKNID